MLPALQSLVNASASLTSQSFNQRNMDYAYLSSKFAGLSPLTAAGLKALVTDFPGFNEDQYLNVRIYQLAKIQGVTTDGAGLTAVVNAALGGPGGVLSLADIQHIIQYAELHRMKAI